MLNILRSHPDTCWPQGEFHEVFRWRGLRREGAARRHRQDARYAPVRLGRGRHPRPGPQGAAGGAARRPPRPRGGAPASPPPPPPTGRRSMRYKAALRAHGLVDGEARAGPDAGQGDELQPRSSRRTFTPSTPTRSSSASSATRRRSARGTSPAAPRSAAAAAAWAFAAGELIALQAALPLKVWRFEDLLADTAGVAGAIYRFAGLDPDAARGRLPAGQGADHRCRRRGPRHPQGRRSSTASTEMGRHMRADANAGARARLPARGGRRRDRRALRARCSALRLSSRTTRPRSCRNGRRGRRRGDGPMTPGLAKRSRRDYRDGRGTVQSGPRPRAVAGPPPCPGPSASGSRKWFTRLPCPSNPCRTAGGSSGCATPDGGRPGRALGARFSSFPRRS